MKIIEKEPELALSSEKGKLGVLHLKRYWSKCMAKRQGSLPQGAFQEEWIHDRTLLHTLGLGLEQTITYVYRHAPGFDEFENWILEVNAGSIAVEKIEQYNASLLNSDARIENTNIEDLVLNKEDLQFWDDHGYVSIKNAVPREDCDATIELICDFLEIKRNDPSTWYKAHPARQGIMIQFFQDPLLQKNRDSKKIRTAYEQLWKRKDIWVTTDRVSFNPPETPNYQFQGPRLHWDVSLDLPIPFGTQGLLYLSDTEENQGAFTLIPGFQNTIESWIHSLPAGANPRTEDLYQLGPKPIAAQAGDFILWHQALPHGSSPNTSKVPRIVQYINYAPLDESFKKDWK